MISIIIPAFNEADHIAETIRQIHFANKGIEIEIIVADGGSTDATVAIANNCGALTVISEKKGRAAQMNTGASFAKFGLLYFLHADTFPPQKFTEYILTAREQDFASGCFRLSFDHDHWFLKANAWFTGFDVNAVRFGDQSLFVTKDVFYKCGRFRDELLLMEDQEIIHRLKKQGKFTVMDAAVITSAEKYLTNGIYRLQRIFFRIWLCYYLGFSQAYLLRLYKRLVK